LGDEMAGQQLICPKCLKVVRVPGGAVAAKPVGGKSQTGRTPAVAVPVTAKPLPPPPPPEQWFYELNGEPCGPVTEAELGEMAEEEDIFPHTLVWTDSQTRWLPAGRAVRCLFKGMTHDELVPPPPGWQKWVGMTLVCLAMAAVFAAGLTHLLTEQKKAAAGRTSGTTTATSGAASPPTAGEGN
jgi:hypothetical protein